MLKWSKKQDLCLQYLESPKYKHVTQVCYGGAAGGGKSFLGCHWQITRRLAYPGTRGLLGRAKLKTLRQTTLETFWEVWRDYYQPYTDTEVRHNHQAGWLQFTNGSKIYLKDLFHYPSDPNFTDLGSMQLTDAFIDQPEEITEKAYHIVYSRIRYKLIDGVKKMLLTPNPANNWVKWNFVLDKNNQPIQLAKHRGYIPAKVTDNPDKTFREDYIEGLKHLPLLDRLRLLDGDWTILENEHPWAYEFSRAKHVGATKWVMSEPLWLAFDFNISPTVCVIGQCIQGIGTHIHDCIEVEGGTVVLCEKIKEKGYHMHPAGFLVTGDNSGHSGSSAAGLVSSGVYNTDYEQIKTSLYMSDHQFIDTRTANKAHVLSRGIVNMAFLHAGVVLNNETCQPLITDIEMAKPKDGTTSKIFKDDKLGYGMHLFDAFRYFNHAVFASKNPTQKIIQFGQLLNIGMNDKKRT